MVISVDFDGTCVTHEFPKTGKNIGAEVVLKTLDSIGHKIICTSMRSSEQKDSFGIDTIKEIKKWFKTNSINLYDINNNPEQEKWSKSRKIYANIYIDDQFLGCPLKIDLNFSKRAFVDWFGVSIYLLRMGIINNSQFNDIEKELKLKYPTFYNQNIAGNE